MKQIEIFAYCFGINGVELPPGITASRLSQPPGNKNIQD
jgi:hypothetical protein